MNPFTLLFIGDLVDIFELLKERGIPVNVWIVGVLVLIVFLYRFAEIVKSFRESFATIKSFFLRKEPEKDTVADSNADKKDKRIEKLFTLPVIFGLEKETREIAREIQRRRIVLITGPGGGGKSTLSVLFARKKRGLYPDGAVFIELAPVQDEGRITRAVADALEVKEGADTSLIYQVAWFLKGKKMLLIFDNCEHVYRGVIPVIREILGNCPDVHFICTSRDYFKAEDNNRFHWLQLESMNTGNEKMSPEEKMEVDAVRLFEYHAKRVNRTFKLSSRTLPHVFSICNTFDGLPLAIILAASRMDFFTVEKISTQLAGFLPEMKSSAAESVTPRHYNMPDVIAWSYNLLEDLQKSTLMNLSVFADDCSPEAIKKVCFEDQVPDESRDEAIEALSKASLLKPSSPKWEEKRFFLLETIRQYGSARLEEAGDRRKMIRKRFCEYYSAFIKVHDSGLLGDELEGRLDKIEEQIGNIRMAFVYMVKYDWIDMMASCCTNLWHFWEIRAQLGEGRERLEYIVGRLPEADRNLQELLNGLGTIVYRQADYEKAREYFERKLELDIRVGDRDQEASTYSDLGNVRGKKGDHKGAIEYYNRALKIIDENKKIRVNAVIFNNIARESLLLGDAGAAKAFFEKSLSYFEEIKNKWESGYPLHGLGMTALYEKDYPMAEMRFQKALGYREEAKDSRNIVQCLLGLALAGLGQNRMDDAGRRIKRASDISWEIRDEMGIHDTFAVAVIILVHTGNIFPAFLIFSYLQDHSHKKANTKLFHVFSENQVSEYQEKHPDHPYEKWLEMGKLQSREDISKLIGEHFENA